MYIDLMHFRLSSKGQIDLLPKCERSSKIKIYDKSCFAGLISGGGGGGGGGGISPKIITLPHPLFRLLSILVKKVLTTREICHKIYSAIIVEIAQK